MDVGVLGQVEFDVEFIIQVAQFLRSQKSIGITKQYKDKYAIQLTSDFLMDKGRTTQISVHLGGKYLNRQRNNGFGSYYCWFIGYNA